MNSFFTKVHTWVNLPYFEVWKSGHRTADLDSLNHTYFGDSNCWPWQFHGHILKLPNLTVWLQEKKCGSNCQGRQFYGHFFKLPNMAGLPKWRGSPVKVLLDKLLFLPISQSVLHFHNWYRWRQTVKRVTQTFTDTWTSISGTFAKHWYTKTGTESRKTKNFDICVWHSHANMIAKMQK